MVSLDPELTTLDTTIGTTNATFRRGNSGEAFVDAPGNVQINIDSNDNQTNAFFSVAKDASDTSLFKVNESGQVDIPGTLVVDGDIATSGSITANEYIVNSSVTNVTQSFSSGSTIFGDSTDDTHEFSFSSNNRFSKCCR